jgi:rhodanese-related sulfurtransferase
MTTLFLDIRNYDEIDKKHFDPKKNTNMDILYMPANIIKYNIPYLLKNFEKYDNIKIICQSGNRSNIIKEKYFKDNKNVLVNDVHFKDIHDNVIISNGIYMNLTRKIQLIVGTIVLLLFILTYFYKYAFIGYLLLGLMMLYVAISGNCFMSSLLTKNEY